MDVSLLEIRRRSRQRADMVTSNFISDDELDDYINAAYTDLYDILVSRWEDYYTLSSTITVAAGASSCQLPTDFYKLIALDKGNLEVPKYAFKDRHTVTELSYRIVKDNLMFMPEASASGNYTLWYVPLAQKLAIATDPVTDGEADSIQDVNGWAEYVVISAAIAMLIKEESDIQPLLLEKRTLIDRIESMASNRDASAPEKITEVWSPFDTEIRIATQ